MLCKKGRVFMKMSNIELSEFCKFLIKEELQGKESRMRTRFIKIAQDRLDEIENERLNLIEKYWKKNEFGEKIIIQENENTKPLLEDENAFINEWIEVLNEEWILDETDERKEFLCVVRNIVINTSQKFKGQEAIFYDKWCEILENMSY